MHRPKARANAMCLIVFSWQQSARHPLVLAANRDEYHDRPARGAHFWDDAPDLCAGRDVRAGGTWLGITRSGRFAAITNHRSTRSAPDGARSRGELTLDFLRGAESPASYVQGLRRRQHCYAGFNLLVGQIGDELYFHANTADVSRRLAPGTYGLSNASLDSPWPKLAGARRDLQEIVARGAETEALLEVLADRTVPGDGELPDTGVGLALERMLGPRFIVSPDYGTRASTALRVSSDGRVELLERSFDRNAVPLRTLQHRFELV
jgi:uncharacterized protein with NRDE domain